MSIPENHPAIVEAKSRGLIVDSGPVKAAKPQLETVSSSGLCGAECLELWMNLPMPPSDNHYYTVTQGQRKARKILSTEGKDYKQLVGTICKGYNQHLTGRLEVAMWLHHKKGTTYDITNRWKALLDALQDAGVFENDSQVDTAVAYRGKCAAEPSVDVCIRHHKE